MTTTAEHLRGVRGFVLGLATAALVCGVAMAVNSGAGAQTAKPPINTAYRLTTPEGNHFYLVFSDPAPGKDAQYNAFYARHLGDIMKLPGFVSAQRFVFHPRANRPDAPLHYLALYEIKGSDPDAIIAQLAPAVKEGRLEAPDKAIMPQTQSSVWTAVGPAGPNR